MSYEDIDVSQAPKEPNKKILGLYLKLINLSILFLLISASGRVQPLLEMIC